MARFTPVEPEWLPLASFDARAAWTGVYPATDIPVRIEAASWRGRPVNFQMVAPWSKPARMQPATTPPPLWVLGIVIALLVLAVLLAWRSFRLGRGDLEERSDWRYLSSRSRCSNGCAPPTTFLVLRRFVGFVVAVSFALLTAGFFWTLYMALEPYVRRRWPQSMIAWSRLLGGAIRDPVVGGNLLIGVAFGVGVALIFLVHNLVLGMDHSEGGALDLNSVLDARHGGGELLSSTVLLHRRSFGLLFSVLSAPQCCCGGQWLAAAVFILLLTPISHHIGESPGDRGGSKLSSSRADSPHHDPLRSAGDDRLLLHHCDADSVSCDHRPFHLVREQPRSSPSQSSSRSPPSPSAPPSPGGRCSRQVFSNRIDSAFPQLLRSRQTGKGGGIRRHLACPWKSRSLDAHRTTNFS